MDNTTPQILNYKCSLFNRLYHGDKGTSGVCGSVSGRLSADPSYLSARVSDQYMCPTVGQPPVVSAPYQPKIAPRDPCGCFARQPLLGKYHICNRENECENPPRCGLALSDKYKFLPERLNSITKDGVLNKINTLKENPDFVYSMDLIKKGTLGLKNCVETNRGNFPRDESGPGVIETFVSSSRAIRRSLENSTLADVTEQFADYLSADNLKYIWDMSSNRCNDLLGNTTVGDVLDAIQTVCQQEEIQRLATKFTQVGGSVYNVINVPVYDHDQYINEMYRLFEQLKSTVDYVCQVFRDRIGSQGYPNRAIRHVQQIQQGLNLCLQMIRFELLDEKKNDRYQ